MAKLVLLHDPHPGIAEALIALPEPMKDCIDSLNLKIMPLEEAVIKIELVANELSGKVEVVENYQYIGFRIIRRDVTPGKINSKKEHYFRLLRYQEV